MSTTHPHTSTHTHTTSGLYLRLCMTQNHLIILAFTCLAYIRFFHYKHMHFHPSVRFMFQFFFFFFLHLLVCLLSSKSSDNHTLIFEHRIELVVVFLLITAPNSTFFVHNCTFIQSAHFLSFYKCLTGPFARVCDDRSTFTFILAFLFILSADYQFERTADAFFSGCLSHMLPPLAKL